MSVCFPSDAATEKRRQAAVDRNSRFVEIEQKLRTDASAVSPAAIAAVTKLYEAGFRKLAQAQVRERCVFESGLGIVTNLPHLQAARVVARVTSVDVRMALDQKDFDRALTDMERLLRLVRDLQPRGFVMTELVGAAITQVVCMDMVNRFLEANGLRVDHCDRLLKRLVAHESKLMDGYTEGLRGDYLAVRASIRELTRHQDVIATQLGLKRGQAITKELFSTPGNSKSTEAADLPDGADAELAHLSTAKITAVVREVSRYYGSLLNLSGVPYSARFKRLQVVKTIGGNDVLTRVLKKLIIEPEAFASAWARSTASLHTVEGLIAIRRWQLTHSGVPADLASVIQGSPLKSIPIDPYDAKPIRMAVIDGQPVIYVVGYDGKDDHAKLDAGYEPRKAGDILYRLPATTKTKNAR